MSPTARKADVVLEGGGVKGIALVGAIEVLENAGYTFERVAGTSAGSIVGSLVAARIPATDLREIMQETDYHRFQDKRPIERFTGPIGTLLSLLLENGIYEGNYLVDYLRTHLKERHVGTFGDLRCDPDPESALPADQRFRLVVMTSDLTERRLVRLPWQSRDCFGTDPADLDVALAVRASMAIPFFFEPYRCDVTVTHPDGSRHRVRHTFVDGGMLSNFPVEVFDRPSGEAPRWPTFGIKLSAKIEDKDKSLPKRVHGPIDQFMAMIGTLTSFHDALYVNRADVQARTIFVDTFGVRATDFDLDRDTQQRLYDSGRRAAETFLGTWSFEDYVATYRTPGGGG